MALKDEGTRFGAISIINHWTIAVLIIVMLAIGLYMDSLPRGPGRGECVVGRDLWHNGAGTSAQILWEDAGTRREEAGRVGVLTGRILKPNEAGRTRMNPNEIMV